MGFAASRGGVVEQTPLAIRSLLLNLGAVPALMAVGSTVLILFYSVPERPTTSRPLTA